MELPRFHSNGARRHLGHIVRITETTTTSQTTKGNIISELNLCEKTANIVIRSTDVDMDNFTSGCPDSGQSNETITELPSFMCAFVNLPDSKIDCSVSSPTVCITCRFLARYITTGDLDQGSPGYLLSLIIWRLTILIGIFGAFANSLIIYILCRKKSKKSFDLLLGALALFDFIATSSAVIVSTAAVAIFGKLLQTKYRSL